MTDKRLLDPVAKTMLDAASLIEAGFCKGNLSTYRLGRPVRCAAGAIIESVPGGTQHYYEALHHFAGYLTATGKAQPGPLHDYIPVIARWNDVPARTQQEVVDALRAAALWRPDANT